MALKGITVLEFAGLAPAPFCGMILNEFGATVIRIDKHGAQPFVQDTVGYGKKSLCINLKKAKGLSVMKNLANQSDVILEPFRKGVMEKLQLGPDVLCKSNPRLIYARLSGYGQDGPYSSMAGHDINYLGLSGILSLLGWRNRNPTPPCNLAADFGGGGLMCALGIVMALFERSKSGRGQVIDCNMVEGSAYLGSWLTRTQDTFLWDKPRGENLLDGGAHFYDTYETKDGRFMAVGALESQFYAQLLAGLGMTEEELPQHEVETGRAKLTEKFKEKTQAEWCEIFDNTDACVTPVLSLSQATSHPHNVHRGSFIPNRAGVVAPAPAPRLSRTPGTSKITEPNPAPGVHTREVLRHFGYSDANIEELIREDVIEETIKMDSKL
ncbi:hypothetical protein M8J75_016033 [Diaphorina citri]|nr:hypothetical protein M8J75_016033 [Diaphorina citri]KAI5743877.1 hypothetical protein M8J77_023192 [Diaphorina citri]